MDKKNISSNDSIQWTEISGGPDPVSKDSPAVYSPDIPQKDLKSMPLSNASETSTDILMSTRWHQTGTILLGSNKTLQYNQYTPLDPESGTHSVTGCTSTAVAQILYYYMEKCGLLLDLTLENTDAYTSQNDTCTISVKADGSTPGTVSFAEINGKLGDYDLNSADDAAALLYACGVILQSEYSAGTTTAYCSKEVFYRAGFAGVSSTILWSPVDHSRKYYWSNTNVSVQNPSYAISDAGFEVLIENLLAGRVIESSIPGHAVVIDGYDSATDTFHINYGWGYSSQTRWYSREEMNAALHYEFFYDIMIEGPEVLTVTDARIYGTGTMLRAFEQAEGIKGKNTVRFADSIKGQELDLLDRIDFSEQISIDGYNLDSSVTLTPSSSWGLFFSADKSAESVAFTNFTGSAVVSTAQKNNCVFYIDNGCSISADLSGALLYAGNYQQDGDHLTGARTIRNSLKNSQNNQTAVEQYIIDSSQDAWTFRCGDGDDKLRLDHGSIAAGSIFLGAGNDTLEILNCSRVYGNLLPGSGSDTVTIDSSSSVTGQFYDSGKLDFLLCTAPAKNAIFTLTGPAFDLTSSAAVSADITLASKGIYTLFAADSDALDMTSLKDFSIRITDDFGYSCTLKTGEYSDDSDFSLFYENDALKLEVRSDMLAGLNISPAGAVWDAASDTTGYELRLSSNDFDSCCSLTLRYNGADFYGLPSGEWSWAVRSLDSARFTGGSSLTNENSAAPAKFTSDNDRTADIFFSAPSGIWDEKYIAVHQGIRGQWQGTLEEVLLNGKNRFEHVFEGADDPGILLLTDDFNGDALFLDDIYSALGDQGRLSRIDEIRAGAGDDIVDMTSQNYFWSGGPIKIYGGSGNDTIWANEGCNILFGDAGNDRIVGGKEDDIISGGSGDDSLHGGGGSDIFCFGNNWGNDSVEQTADGEVCLWFETGSHANWIPETSTYSDGENSVSVCGVSPDRITLKFGDPSHTLPNGAFAEFTTVNVFETCNVFNG